MLCTHLYTEDPQPCSKLGPHLIYVPAYLCVFVQHETSIGRVSWVVQAVGLLIVHFESWMQDLDPDALLITTIYLALFALMHGERLSVYATKVRSRAPHGKNFTEAKKTESSCDTCPTLCESNLPIPVHL